MSNKTFARIWSIVLALLLIATLVANYFAMKYSTIITRSLGHSTSKTVASTEPGDSEYFKSDFLSHDELVAYQKEFSRQLVGEGVVLLRNDDNGLPLTSKGDTDNHGFGLRSMRKIAEKYQGTLSVKLEDKAFLLYVMLPLPSAAVH